MLLVPGSGPADLSSLMKNALFCRDLFPLAFQEVTRSGMPMPSRWTFTAALRGNSFRHGHMLFWGLKIF
jgi:hypothetical protein